MNCGEFFQSIGIFFTISMIIAFLLVIWMQISDTNMDNTGVGIICISPILSIPLTIFLAIKVYVSPKHKTNIRKRKSHD